MAVGVPLSDTLLTNNYPRYSERNIAALSCLPIEKIGVRAGS
ncbi:hypothetical protein [Desulfosporosinus sp. FKA]|nr:hypothetical protein [Desulfosporosinus sp. FKA]